MTDLLVKKRNGKTESFDVNKINIFLERCCEGVKNVSASEIAIDAQITFRDKIPTSEIDQALELTARSKIWKHPNYGKVASRIIMSCLYKEIIGESVDHDTFEADYRSKFIKNIKRGVKCGIIDKRMLAYDLKLLADSLVITRDDEIDYIGIKNLADRYFLKDPNGKLLETPQAFYMRIAMGLCFNDPTMVLDFYHMYSRHLASPSTPTLFNSGTTHPQLSSCYLSMIDDSVDGIFDGLWQEARKSKYAGGLGFHMGGIRSANSKIVGTNGKSSGLIPWMKIYNDMLVAVNQGGKRPGSGCAYIEPWHKDIYEFVDVRKNTGDDRIRCRDLQIALWIPDLFMERVEADADWTLFCPRDCPELNETYGSEFRTHYEKYETTNLGKKVRAKDLWKHILRALFETSHPWICFKDRSNERYTNKHMGIVHGSNLCVAPNTLLLTSNGYIPIAELENEYVDVWNGKVWSRSLVAKTGERQHLVTVVLSDGKKLSCTKYHDWYTVKNYNHQRIGKLTKKKTHELCIGDKLCKFEVPTIDGDEEFKYAYTHGLFCADGTRESASSRRISLYGEKKELVEFLETKTDRGEDSSSRHNIVVHEDMAEKFFVPMNSSIKTKIEWLSGLFDGDGTIARNGDNESIQICSVEPQFLREIQLLLQTLGVQSKISPAQDAGERLMPDGCGGYKMYECRSTERLLISSCGLYMLHSLGLKTNRLKYEFRLPQREASQFVTVKEIIDSGEISDTYCVGEPLENKAVFNGILTGNCTEIILRNKAPKYKDGVKTEHGLTAVCTLASVCLPNHMELVDDVWMIDYPQLQDTVEKLIRSLDNVIDINFYPTEEARIGATEDRPLGMGTIGWVNVLARLGIAADSEEAVQVASELTEFISYHAILTSHKLSQERGSYPTFNGSLWSNGILPIDSAIDQIAHLGITSKFDWEPLRELVSKGMRNSNLLAIAPNASIAYILGFSQSVEPNLSIAYAYENLSSITWLVDKDFVAEMEREGLWSTEFADKCRFIDGDTSLLPISEKQKAIYKGAFKMNQFGLIKTNAARQVWIDQAISFNLYNAGTSIKHINDMYFAAWKDGLKTTYYLRNVRANKAEQIESEQKACSISDPTCESCHG